MKFRQGHEECQFIRSGSLHALSQHAVSPMGVHFDVKWDFQGMRSFGGYLASVPLIWWAAAKLARLRHAASISWKKTLITACRPNRRILI
jgi:hypothetical protein